MVSFHDDSKPHAKGLESVYLYAVLIQKLYLDFSLLITMPVVALNHNKTL